MYRIMYLGLKQIRRRGMKRLCRVFNCYPPYTFVNRNDEWISKYKENRLGEEYK
jgi:hypothetical protein